MAGSLVIVHLPQAIYHRLEQAAARLRKPVDTLLAETLEAALPDESGIAPELIAAMKAVELLDKRGLQQVIAADMQTEDQAALDDSHLVKRGCLIEKRHRKIRCTIVAHRSIK